MTRAEARAEVERRDRRLLHALEVEQDAGWPSRKPSKVLSLHRLTPIPRELHERGGATRWLCQACRAQFDWQDQAIDVDCPAIEMQFGE